ncbi:hypothetical protein HYH03_008899 [Edaphochlamys debaryana]|uniref:Guanylate cyclase domain-containing protein n=1 Tax=Edaphochlamys debaryana TaxID=47281 RepID=A0A836BYW1_9CHLO|nr:hypothetical protein HYH03_008899 [Edaphochlamys debaryana]|eukprot:KAG2492733.1 hypothetical protein HYH03_008899 [Edaphochlamys debaryana]
MPLPHPPALQQPVRSLRTKTETSNRELLLDEEIHQTVNSDSEGRGVVDSSQVALLCDDCDVATPGTSGTSGSSPPAMSMRGGSTPPANEQPCIAAGLQSGSGWTPSDAAAQQALGLARDSIPPMARGTSGAASDPSGSQADPRGTQDPLDSELEGPVSSSREWGGTTVRSMRTTSSRLGPGRGPGSGPGGGRGRASGKDDIGAPGSPSLRFLAPERTRSCLEPAAVLLDKEPSTGTEEAAVASEGLAGGGAVVAAALVEEELAAARLTAAESQAQAQAQEMEACLPELDVIGPEPGQAALRQQIHGGKVLGASPDVGMSGAARSSSNEYPTSHSSWVDTATLWTAVQRNGEEAQRRMRANGECQEPSCMSPYARWRASMHRGVQRFRTQMVVWGRVAARDPSTVAVPLFLLCLMLAFGLWGVFSVGYAIQDQRKQAAMNGAVDFSKTLTSHISATMAPATTFKTIIEMDPTWDAVNATFHAKAPGLVQKGRESDAIITIVLAPMGIVRAIVPPDLPAWQQVYNLDLLQNLTWRTDAIRAVKLYEQGMVMTGPTTLRAGMMGIVTRYPVFIDGAGPDEMFGLPGPKYWDCPPCFVPATPSKPSKQFWGFSQLNVDWEILTRNVTRMYDLCERDSLHFNMTYILPTNNSNVSIGSCGHMRNGPPISVEILVMNNRWVLSVTDSRGWTPNWLPLVVTVVVLASLWIALTLAIILINRREHMWLLQAMLPDKVIAALRRGEDYAEAFECVTVLFSDIVSYTTIASSMEPIKVVRLLNEMYSAFDTLVDQYECYKVETIGDAFMAVCGTQGEDPVAAAVRVARLAQAMVERTRVLVSADGQKIQIRIGLHSGPVVGAVVGFKMPHFCLCGDTVNTASRMETTSQPMRVHISESTASLLATAVTAGEAFFQTMTRGPIEVKGKGTMTTYWLLPNAAQSPAGHGATSATLGFTETGERGPVDPNLAAGALGSNGCTRKRENGAVQTLFAAADTPEEESRRAGQRANTIEAVQASRSAAAGALVASQMQAATAAAYAAGVAAANSHAPSALLPSPLTAGTHVFGAGALAQARSRPNSTTGAHSGVNGGMQGHSGLLSFLRFSRGPQSPFTTRGAGPSHLQGQPSLPTNPSSVQLAAGDSFNDLPGEAVNAVNVATGGTSGAGSADRSTAGRRAASGHTLPQMSYTVSMDQAPSLNIRAVLPSPSVGLPTPMAAGGALSPAGSSPLPPGTMAALARGAGGDRASRRQHQRSSVDLRLFQPASGRKLQAP